MAIQLNNGVCDDAGGGPAEFRGKFLLRNVRSKKLGDKEDSYECLSNKKSESA